jgi:protein phosphatase 1 regulatory subunit 7
MNADFDITTIEGRTTLWVNSERIEECVEAYFSRKIDILGINPLRGFGLSNIDFLKNHPDISGLSIVFPATNSIDISPVIDLKSLRVLWLSGRVDIDLSLLPLLYEFRGYWCDYLRIDKCYSIRRLALIKFLSKTGYIDGLDCSSELIELSLTQSNISALRGISKFKGLEKLGIYHMSKLTSISDIEALPVLYVLDVESCKKIVDIPSVGKNDSIRILRINYCGQIDNVRFIEEMKNLEEFSFVGTNVADGDLSHLLRLKSVGFIAKKSYSHKPNDFLKA